MIGYKESMYSTWLESFLTEMVMLAQGVRLRCAVGRSILVSGGLGAVLKDLPGGAAAAMIKEMTWMTFLGCPICCVPRESLASNLLFARRYELQMRRQLKELLSITNNDKHQSALASKYGLLPIPAPWTESYVERPRTLAICVLHLLGGLNSDNASQLRNIITGSLVV